MRFRLVATLLLSALTFGEAQTVSFNRTPVKGFPEGWDAYMTHSGGAPRWQVIQDAATSEKPRVLAQLSDDATRSRFPLAIFREASVQNGTISVSFKAISGKIDQGAGLVWRFVDADNYYLVRANALEDNVVLYKVEKGTRTALAPKGTQPGTYGVNHKVASQVWNRMSVSFNGNNFIVKLNGDTLFEVEDKTFTGEGKTGLWTKADSVIYFRDFEVKKDGSPTGH